MPKENNGQPYMVDRYFYGNDIKHPDSRTELSVY